MTTEPVGGSNSRFTRLVMPNLPEPCIMVWFGNGGVKVPAWPASVPTVSTPTPRISRSIARNSEHVWWKPGECAPSAATLRNSSRPVRELQPVRSNTHAPAGMRPCSASHTCTLSTDSRKSVFCFTSAVTSIMHAGPMNLRGWMVSVALLGRSLPVTQWIGASKCVPVCSPILIMFQYQAGPLLSYREISVSVTPGDGANIGGRSITTVSGPSGVVKSTTFNVPEFNSSSNCDKTLEPMLTPFFTCVLASFYCHEQSCGPVELCDV